MPHRLLAILVLLPACVGLDLDSEPCPDGCSSEGAGIEVLTYFVALPDDAPLVVARAGTVDLFVDHGGEYEDRLEVDVTGGVLAALDHRSLTVRAAADELQVEVDIGDWGDYLRLDSRPLESIRLMPAESQFSYGRPVPEVFAFARDSFVSVVIELLAGETRLFDSSLRTTGPAIGPEALGDVVIVRADLDPVTFTVTGGGFSRDVELPIADQVDSISVVAADGLDDPQQPITLGDDRRAQVCFTALTGEVPVVGLAWHITGEGVEEEIEACATIEPQTTSLTVEAGELSRTFAIEIEDR